MSQELEGILTVLFTEPENLATLLHGIDREVLADCFADILYRYANDVNSSTLRELITMLKAGYSPQPSGTKLGYNGKTHHGEPCEIKPPNIRSDSGNKLNGGGNFSDFTYERLDKYQADNVMMLVSGFVDGRLIYILEFPFKYTELVQRLEEQLAMHFERGKREKGQFLRSAQFSFKHYKNCPQLKVIYKEPNINAFRGFLTGQLFSYLKEGTWKQTRF